LRGASWLVLGLVLAGAASAQRQEELLKRIRDLEAKQAELAAEIAALRGRIEVAGATPVEERIEVQEQRTADLARTKVEASQRQPVSLRGMVLVNAFVAGPNNGSRLIATFADAGSRRLAGGSVQQSILALDFHGPQAWGANWTGSIEMDFFAGGTSATALQPRLRTGWIQADWRRFRMLAGQDKPLISPYSPASLAQVGVPALTDAGNLWVWQPQVRFEYRQPAGEQWRMGLQGAVVQTNEEGALAGQSVFTDLKRPGWQSRVTLDFGTSENPRWTLGSGMHRSRTLANGGSAASFAWTADWRWRAASWAELTGLAYRGENLAHFGALRQGFVRIPGGIRGVRSAGGWAQWKLDVHPRLSLHLFGGQHDDRNRDLRGTGIGKNQSYAVNAMWRIDTNLVAAFEAGETRTSYLGAGLRRVRRYDLSLAYFF
jgi:outer membrane murein-binding lipoprotein Lpp